MTINASVSSSRFILIPICYGSMAIIKTLILLVLGPTLRRQ